MEKYSVMIEDPVGKTASDTEVCKKCGLTLTKTSNVPHCKTCGTEPSEVRPTQYPSSSKSKP